MPELLQLNWQRNRSESFEPGEHADTPEGTYWVASLGVTTRSLYFRAKGEDCIRSIFHTWDQAEAITVRQAHSLAQADYDKRQGVLVWQDNDNPNNRGEHADTPLGSYWSLCDISDTDLILWLRFVPADGGEVVQFLDDTDESASASRQAARDVCQKDYDARRQGLKPLLWVEKNFWSFTDGNESLEAVGWEAEAAETVFYQIWRIPGSEAANRVAVKTCNPYDVQVLWSGLSTGDVKTFAQAKQIADAHYRQPTEVRNLEQPASPQQLVWGPSTSAEHWNRQASIDGPMHPECKFVLKYYLTRGQTLASAKVHLVTLVNTVHNLTGELYTSELDYLRVQPRGVTLAQARQLCQDYADQVGRESAAMAASQPPQPPDQGGAVNRPVTETDLRDPQWRAVNIDALEFRADGQVVRKDRFQVGILNIAAALGAREMEIPDLTAQVRALLKFWETHTGGDPRSWSEYWGSGDVRNV